MKIFLETERLILRQLTEEDADNLFEIVIYALNRTDWFTANSK